MISPLPILTQFALSFAAKAYAQTFNGPGLHGGVQEATGISGPIQGDVRSVTLLILYHVLSYLALAAVVTIVIAGVILVLSGGGDAGKDRAKKMIYGVALGLLVILLARTGVGFMLYGIF